jgi:hypothetical protein
MSSIISLNRESDYFAILRKYRVMIDGQNVGELPYGETRLFHVPPGSHKVQVRIDWWKSNPLNIDTCDRVTYYLECGCSLRGWRLTLSLLFGWWFLFWPTRWVWLRTASNPAVHGLRGSGLNNHQGFLEG